MVWRPVFDVFKYSGNKKISNSNLLDEKKKLLYRVNEFRYPARNWLKCRARKIKSMLVYKLLQDHGKFYKLYKRVTFQGFLKHYGINKTNRVIGFTPDYVGSSTSQPVNSINYVSRFLRENIDLIKSCVSSSCYYDLLLSSSEERVTYSAGFDSCGEHLKEYLKDNKTEGQWSVKNIFKILKLSNFEWFRSPKVDFSNGLEILTTVKTNPDAFAGHYTAMLFGKSKRYSDFASKNIAYEIWNKMLKEPVKNFYLWTILGREKDIKIDTTKTKEVGTRVVMTTENPITLLLCWFAQKISYTICSDKLWDCKFNINDEFDSSKYKRLIDKESNFDFVLEADWRYYDSNIDTNFLIAAGLLICFGLPRDRLHKNIRYLIISSIVTKYVIIPPGLVVELNRAQPSGHPFGTLVNCYVNLIYWSLIGYKIYGENYGEMMDIEVYGDDTRAFFKYHPNLSNIDLYVSECGLASEPLLPNFRSVGEEPKSSFQIDFLKRRFSEKGIKWNHKKMFDKFLYPSKNRNINDQYLMVSSWFDSVPTDYDAKVLRTLFGDYLKENYDNLLSNSTKLLILKNSGSSGSDYRAVNKFTFDSFNYKFNSDYDRNISFFTDTLIFRKGQGDYDLSKTDYRIYNDNSSILAIMISCSELSNDYDYLSNIILGRDPPLIKIGSNVSDLFKRLIDINIRELEFLVKRSIRSPRN